MDKTNYEQDIKLSKKESGINHVKFLLIYFFDQ